ncbi:MAG TPA: hypothetical protein VFY94_05515 [Rhodanobacteraceae bacterium]|jgi:hypothetical protein|nr:hypothetical protein [Rhodanobacteraceae bacterium]
MAVKRVHGFVAIEERVLDRAVEAFVAGIHPGRAWGGVSMHEVLAGDGVVAVPGNFAAVVRAD